MSCVKDVVCVMYRGCVCVACACVEVMGVTWWVRVCGSQAAGYQDAWKASNQDFAWTLDDRTE